MRKSTRNKNGDKQLYPSNATAYKMKKMTKPSKKYSQTRRGSLGAIYTGGNTSQEIYISKGLTLIQLLLV